MTHQNTVFISYRRGTGAALARNIRDGLRKRRFHVFMDVDDLRAGPFDTALYEQIETATDVVVVLTPGSLERCFENPDDWFRLEVAYALKLHKNVVPVLGTDFAWPATRLPDDLDGLSRQSGLSSSHDYFEASMDRLAERFLSRFGGSWTRRRFVTTMSLSICVLAVVLGMLWRQNRFGGKTWLPSFLHTAATSDALFDAKSLGSQTLKRYDVQVLARDAWYDTGIAVEAGDRLEFVASGTWNYDQQRLGPDGTILSGCFGCVVPSANIGELIGQLVYAMDYGTSSMRASGNRVSTGKAPFRIGSSSTRVADFSGNLMLAMNIRCPVELSRCYEKNSGAIRVRVTIVRFV